jgi:uncharacterized GH25 family protein
MRRLTNGGIVVAVAFALAFVVACNSEPAADQAQGTEITFKSDPETPKMGDNTFEVMVMQDGKPVDDAQVSVEFFMPAMPEMKMAEMRTKADLTSAGNGIDRGAGQVMMAGNWEVTVMAMRNGQEIGRKKLSVTAK